MKLAAFRVISSLLLTLVMNSVAKAQSLQSEHSQHSHSEHDAVSFSTANATNLPFPDIEPDPNPLQIQGPAGELFTFIKTSATTNGRYTLAEALVPPGAGPLPHIHRKENEWFYFPDGNVQLQMGDSFYPEGSIPGTNAPRDTLHTITTTPGSLFYGPKNMIHGFTNQGETTSRIVLLWTPGGIEEYFKTVGQIVTEPSNPPDVNPDNKTLFVSEAPRFNINQSAYFDQYIGSVDNNFPVTDNRYNELLALVAPELRRAVPESSSPLGALAFGASFVMLIIGTNSRHSKSESTKRLAIRKSIPVTNTLHISPEK